MYHYVRDTAATSFPAIRALAPAAFEQQLDWLSAQGTIVTPHQLNDALNGVAPLPADAIVLTFDDGFIDHYETVFPVLRARDLSGMFFVTRAAIDSSPELLSVHQIQFLLAALGAETFARAVLDECRAVPERIRSAVYGNDRWDDEREQSIKELLNYTLPFDDANRVLDTVFRRCVGDPVAFARDLYLDARMIRNMAAGGMVFGYHTRTHRMLSRLSVAEQSDELRDGVAWITDMTAQSMVPFCYPWGSPQTYTADTVRILADAGYSYAFNTVRRPLRIGIDNKYELPRVDTRDLPPHEPQSKAVRALVERNA